MAPFWRGLATMPTAPFTVLLWLVAVFWLQTFTITPALDFEHVDAAVLIPIKSWWAGPAAVAVFLPLLGTAVRRRWLSDLVALYRVAWWLFLALSLFAVVPSLSAAWGPPAIATAISFWLLARRASTPGSAIWPATSGGH